MKKIYALLFLAPALYTAQVGYNITSWKLNTTGATASYYDASNNVITMTDSSEVQQVCYDTDTIYVRANMLAAFIMGDWPNDPFVCDGQNNSYIFKRNPTYPSSTHPSKPVGIQGLLINGVAIFSDGDGKSYNSSTGTNNNAGSGVWNQIAWVAHANEMDAGGGHPDPNQIYHNHSNPTQLYSATATTTHSPIIGWSFDGWPIYGPFGYSVATNSSSAVTRMTSSWALRNITTRTTLYTGTSTSQTGPAVSSTFPLGTYIEDYGYTAGSGDLDYYNGRYCVTPEYPSGTYAYFLNTDASGNASYPSMIGPNYYSGVFTANFGMSGGSAAAPKVGVSCYTGLTSFTEELAAENGKLKIYPNPAETIIQLTANSSVINIFDVTGRVVISVNVTSPGNVQTIDVSALGAGSYLIQDGTATNFFIKK